MNPNVANVPGSLIRALHARRTPATIDLGLGEPTLMPDMRHFETATAWVAQHGCRYSSNLGHDDLRAAIAQHYGYPGLDQAANVCITTGSQEAVYVALKTLIDPAADELLLVEPAFPVYAKIAQIEGIALRRVVLDPANGCALEAEPILAALGPRTRMIVLCSPNNPTGRVISRGEARKLADALLARRGPPVYVLHDEIYRELSYTDDAGELGKLYPYTIAINSLSKSNALTGLRLGWMFAPSDVMPHVVKMHGWATSCASTFAQRVAYEIFAAGELATQRAWYVRQQAGALAAAREAGFALIEPEGAFYICLRVGAEDTLAFAETLIDDRDVIAIPGHIFGESLTGWLRTSFVGNLDVVREGYRRIAAHVASRLTTAQTT
jgi:aspartate/methionine/tyrosine aminotransferase